MDLPTSQYQLSRTRSSGEASSQSSSSAYATTKSDTETLDSSGLAYQYEVAKACGLALDRRILTFQEQPPVSDKEELKAKYNRPMRPTTASNIAKRKIPTVPERYIFTWRSTIHSFRILDAPGIADDYYLNLLDWSSSNVLAVGLGSAVYLWNASSGTVDELCSLDEDEPVTSISWCQDGTHIAIADNNGETHIWDVESKSRLRTMRDVPSRIGSLAWNRQLVSTGNRDGSIHNHDVRLAQSRTGDLVGHEGDVCGLKWSMDGSQLASGGNDNLVNIWDARTTVAKYTKRDHTAAVKVWVFARYRIGSRHERLSRGVHGSPICWPLAVAVMIARFASGIPHLVLVRLASIPDLK